MRWRSRGGMHSDKSQTGGRQRPWGKGGGVSGVRLGNDGMLTGCGWLKQEGGACKW